MAILQRQKIWLDENYNYIDNFEGALEKLYRSSLGSIAYS